MFWLIFSLFLLSASRSLFNLLTALPKALTMNTKENDVSAQFESRPDALYASCEQMTIWSGFSYYVYQGSLIAHVVRERKRNKKKTNRKILLLHIHSQIQLSACVCALFFRWNVKIICSSISEIINHFTFSVICRNLCVVAILAGMLASEVTHTHIRTVTMLVFWNFSIWLSSSSLVLIRDLPTFAHTSMEAWLCECVFVRAHLCDFLVYLLL